MALADDWVQAAQRDWAMAVQSAADPQGAVGEMVWQLKRSGADGTLRVTSDRFMLDLRLGFLLGTFKDRIEARGKQYQQQIQQQQNAVTGRLGAQMPGPMPATPVPNGAPQ